MDKSFTYANIVVIAAMTAPDGIGPLGLWAQVNIAWGNPPGPDTPFQNANLFVALQPGDDQGEIKSRIEAQFYTTYPTLPPLLLLGLK
jgi:hypothetical protein